ncbi:unnamed protein product [Camellia sinensis]
MILSIALTQELKFDQENDVHFLDAWPKSVNVGNFVFVFEARFSWRDCSFVISKPSTKAAFIISIDHSTWASI